MLHSLILTVLLLVLLNGCGTSEVDWAPVMIPVAAGDNSAQPHLSRTDTGLPVLSWLQPDSDRTQLLYSILENDRWSMPRLVAVGDDWFVNWADFPSVVPLHGDTWAAHWLAKKPGGTYAYDVALSVSSDGGKSWSVPVTPHTDNTATEHGFVTLFPLNDDVGIVWLDGRHTTEQHDHDTASAGQPPDAATSGMTLRSAAIDRSGEIVNGAEIDDLVCDCCQTDVALTDSGPLVIYRNRTVDETRDIYAARLVDGVWQSLGAVSDDAWIIAGCPVNGPAVSARQNDVVVAWFTASEQRSRVLAAYSRDGGRSFTPPVAIDDQKPLGRVGVELVDKNRFVVSWLQRTIEGGALAMSMVSDGVPGPVRIVAAMDSSRSAGVPQMVLAGDELIFAWTTVDNDTTRVSSARVRID